ncbi:Nramp family divalent metal transporter [Candidatus Latescibacterota bacterium]
MSHDQSHISFIRRFWILILSVGPGIFMAGGIIGTGSVTAMAKAGSQFGMQLLWVLFISCLFSWVLTEAYGRFAVITGETALYGFKTRLKGGKIIALFTMVGAIAGLFCAIMGIMGFSSNLIYESLHLFIPGLELPQYGAVLGIAIIVILILYAMLWVGRYSFFEKVLVIFVTLMGMSFIISSFLI